MDMSLSKLAVGDGQGGLAELDTTEWLNWLTDRHHFALTHTADLLTLIFTSKCQSVFKVKYHIYCSIYAFNSFLKDFFLVFNHTWILPLQHNVLFVIYGRLNILFLSSKNFQASLPYFYSLPWVGLRQKQVITFKRLCGMPLYLQYHELLFLESFRLWDQKNKNLMNWHAVLNAGAAEIKWVLPLHRRWCRQLNQYQYSRGDRQINQQRWFWFYFGIKHFTRDLSKSLTW